MTKTYDEMIIELKTLMRCQLYALPNGKELYAKIIPQMRDDLKSVEEITERLRMVFNGYSTVDCWCSWSSSKEGFDFWSDVDTKIKKLIQSRRTPWLTSPIPTIIEVDE